MGGTIEEKGKSVVLFATFKGVCVSKIERLDFFAMPDQDSKQYYAYTFSTPSFSVGALISARCVIHRRRG